MHWVLQENLFQERERAQIRAAVERWALLEELEGG